MELDKNFRLTVTWTQFVQKLKKTKVKTNLKKEASGLINAIFFN